MDGSPLASQHTCNADDYGSSDSSQPGLRHLQLATPTHSAPHLDAKLSVDGCEEGRKVLPWQHRLQAGPELHKLLVGQHAVVVAVQKVELPAGEGRGEGLVGVLLLVLACAAVWGREEGKWSVLVSFCWCWCWCWAGAGVDAGAKT